jgi:hypothetical protein
MQLFVLFTGLETKLGQNRDLGGLIDAYLWDEDARRERFSPPRDPRIAREAAPILKIGHQAQCQIVRS